MAEILPGRRYTYDTRIVLSVMEVIFLLDMHGDFFKRGTTPGDNNIYLKDNFHSILGKPDKKTDTYVFDFYSGDTDNFKEAKDMIINFINYHSLLKCSVTHDNQFADCLDILYS